MNPAAADRVIAWTEHACAFVLWNLAWSVLVVFTVLLVRRGVIP